MAAAQLADDVVTTLGFGCILVVTLDNVVTTLSQRFVSYIVTTTKNERCYKVVFSTSVFRPGINVGATSWFWCRFPDVNLYVFPYHYKFLFPKTCNIALQFHFLVNKILYVSMQSVRSNVCSNGGYFKICNLLFKQRKGIFLGSSLIRNSSLFSGGKFGRVVL